MQVFQEHYQMMEERIGKLYDSVIVHKRKKLNLQEEVERKTKELELSTNKIEYFNIKNSLDTKTNSIRKCCPRKMNSKSISMKWKINFLKLHKNMSRVNGYSLRVRKYLVMR